MNVFKLFLFLLLFSSLSSFSQGYYNNQGNYTGLDRRLSNAGANNSTQSKPTPEGIEKERTARIEKFMVKLKEELTLDELQQIAIRNEITSNSKNVDIVMKKEITDEGKNTEIKALMEKTEARINSYLNKEQKEKFKVFSENLKTKKTDKKDKKGKKEDKPIEE
jgi:predicted RND superfamily exporter protein